MAKKVLIIEDSKTDANIVRDLLTKEGIEVTVATDGADGIKKAQTIRPDLIILDLVLPDIGGYEVCSRIKKNVSLKKSLVIILSVKDDIADITRAFHEGADDYIIKPPSPDFLVRKLKLYLGIR